MTWLELGARLALIVLQIIGYVTKIEEQNVGRAAQEKEAGDAEDARVAAAIAARDAALNGVPAQDGNTNDSDWTEPSGVQGMVSGAARAIPLEARPTHA